MLFCGLWIFIFECFEKKQLKNLHIIKNIRIFAAVLRR